MATLRDILIIYAQFMGALLPNAFAPFLHGKEVTVWMMSCGPLVSSPESYTQLADECHNPFPELSPTYIYMSQPSLVSYRVHSSSPSQLYNMPHESIPIASDSALTSYPLKPSSQSRPSPIQWSQRIHTQEDNCIISCHVANHVTEVQPCITQAALLAGHLLSIPGS